MQWQSVLLKYCSLSVVYALIVAGWGNLSVAHASFIVIWLPLGVAVAVMEFVGPSLLPAVFTGSLLGYLAFHSSLPEASLFAATQTASAYLVNKFSFLKTKQGAKPSAVNLWSRGFQTLVPAAILSVVVIFLVPANREFSETTILLGLVSGFLVMSPALCFKLERHFKSLLGKLKERNAEMAAIAKTLPDAILIQDINGNYLSRFSDSPSLTGLLDALPEPNIKFIEDPAYVKARLSMLRRAWKSGRLQTEVLIQKLEGVPAKQLEVRVVPYKDQMCIVMVRDITEAWQTQQELSAVERKAASILEAAPDMMFLVDASFHISQIISKRKSSPFVSANDLLAQHINSFLPQDRIAEAQELFRKLFETRAMQTAELPVQFKGHLRWFEMRIVPYDTDQVLVVCRDIHVEKMARAVAQEKTALLNLVSENIDEVVILRDLEEKIVFVTPSLTEITGYRLEDIVETNLPAVLPLPTVERLRRMAQSDLQRRLHSEFEITTKDGRNIWVETDSRPLLDENGELTHVLTVSRDITERRLADTRQRIADLMVQNIKEGLIFSNLQGKIIGVNPAFLRMTQYMDNEVMGQQEELVIGTEYNSVDKVTSLNDAIAMRQEWHGEYLSRRKDGSVFPGWRRTSFISDELGEAQFMLTLISDLSQEQAKDELIWKLSTHDAITGLPNRAFFSHLLEYACTRAKARNTRVAVFTVQLARLRFIRENMGPDHSALLVRSVAERANQLAPEFDGLGILQDSEFSFLKEDAGEMSEISLLGHKLSKLFEKPFKLGNDEIYIQANIGIAVYPDDAKTPDRLVSCSALAVLAAVQRGPTVYRFYSSAMGSQSDTEMKLESEFRKALLTNELSLQYQPKVSLVNGKLIGFEALSRWASPKLGMVSPARFIPLAEASGLIVPLGEKTLREAVATLAKWKREGRNLVPIAVNLSLQHIQSTYLQPLLAALLDEFDVPAQYLEIEITESTAMIDADRTISVFKQLREMGFGVVLDDFGTGYSSLSHLMKLPLTAVKIDKSFVESIGTVEGDALCRGTLSIANALKLETVAEGVETEEQRRVLSEMGCAAFQGYLFSQAVSAPEAVAMLSD